MKTLFMTLILAAGISSQGLAQHSHHDHLPEGGRTGLHGMVLFGSNGEYFLDHIPMNMAPHDMQVVARIVLKNKNGQDLNLNLANKTFTLKPNENFSLNDYASGKLKNFEGDIFSGGFEQGGKLINGLDGVQVIVIKIEIAEQLPLRPQRNIIFQVATNYETFEINRITSARNFQQIKNKKTGEVLWCVVGPDFFEPCE